MATTWGELQARAQLRGRPRPINDTWIAACCLVEGLPLATFNTKDFTDFAEHDGLARISAQGDRHTRDAALLCVRRETSYR